MNGTTILIDIDDTIEYLCKTWVDWLNIKYHSNVKYEDITEWDIRSFFPTLSKEEVFYPIHQSWFWKLVKPMPGAIKYIKKLIEDGFQVYLCTSTDYRNVRPKYEFIIKRYFPYIAWEQVIITYKKQMINADILIDDGIHNLEGGTYFKILFTAPHNRKYDAEKHDMVRANNWDEVYKIVRDYAHNKGGVTY